MAVVYRLNGVELTQENGGLPSKHRIEPSTFNMKETIGAVVLIEPPAGRRRTFTWEYDGQDGARYATQVKFLMDALDYESSPMSVIDCPDVEADPDTGQPIQLLDIRVVCTQRPPLSTPGHRDMVESFSLVFVEQFPQ